MSQEYWQRSNGELIKIVDMNDYHLRNSIAKAYSAGKEIFPLMIDELEKRDLVSGRTLKKYRHYIQEWPFVEIEEE